MKNDYISEIYEKDKLVLHPYENFNDRGTYNRKLITKSDNIYLYDENGNKFIDGPGECGAIILVMEIEKLVKR